MIKHERKSYLRGKKVYLTQNFICHCKEIYVAEAGSHWSHPVHSCEYARVQLPFYCYIFRDILADNGATSSGQVLPPISTVLYRHGHWPTSSKQFFTEPPSQVTLVSAKLTMKTTAFLKAFHIARGSVNLEGDDRCEMQEKQYFHDVEKIEQSMKLK